MRELPILYSPDMVRAKLAGRKTQTRRNRGLSTVNADPNHYVLLRYEETNDGLYAVFFDTWIDAEFKVKSPYGKVGDILYVRETTQIVFDEITGREKREYIADNPTPAYLLDGDGFQVFNKVGSERLVPHIPSIHMPKEAARIWERVTNVRVERLHDITEADAIAEGVEEMPGNPGTYRNYLQLHGHLQGNAVESYFTIWISIYGRESFDSNPWLWVYETELLSTTGRPGNI